jgi:hypothetical protein
MNDRICVLIEARDRVAFTYRIISCYLVVTYAFDYVLVSYAAC